MASPVSGALMYLFWQPYSNTLHAFQQSSCGYNLTGPLLQTWDSLLMLRLKMLQDLWPVTHAKATSTEEFMGWTFVLVTISQGNRINKIYIYPILSYIYVYSYINTHTHICVYIPYSKIYIYNIYIIYMYIYNDGG